MSSACFLNKHNCNYQWPCKRSQKENLFDPYLLPQGTSYVRFSENESVKTLNEAARGYTLKDLFESNVTFKDLKWRRLDFYYVLTFHKEGTVHVQFIICFSSFFATTHVSSLL